ncbi:bifunctional glycosyltransferase/CDP-glycerol:glycerophosphate glycerophosphotransferase [Streptomyces sp. NRRL S-1448]|uniref:bifunctional glycosyltransferase/CDP-glycerol:glycerophosphate glycerophosphotransferase n=1 Tax=Streptomyces sp. NRRL S-1448 TaxID=1463883 RepID=UPI0004C18C0B|nr:CDP-glycerol glycerophosphotransferase family protein [Streptomyces sp. NRRL S-1448]
MKPRLTVVVPVPRGAGAEGNLEECLASVAAQTLTELDVVLVEGGPAGAGPSSAVAHAVAERDPRFRIVHLPGGDVAGCGAARNAGARHAFPHTGYLAFLDADDVLLPRAYEDLVGVLERSGADLATGNVYRLGAAGRSQSARHPAGRQTVLGTHVTEDLTLLADSFARNKVFRREFWDRHGFAFPEGELCLDEAVTVPAHFLAGAVDVLREHVCYWRLPEGAARHRRPDPRGVRERFAAVAAIRRFLGEAARPQLHAYRRDFDRFQLTEGLADLVAGLPGAAPETRTAFLDCARDFLAGVDPRVFPELPVELRMRWYLVRAGRAADLLTLLRHEARNPAGFAVAGPPLRRRAVVPVSPPLELPPGVTRLGREDFPVCARVREAVWRDGVLVLRGHAYVRNVDAAHRHTVGVRTAVLSCGRRRIVLPLRTVAMPEATAESGQELHCYDWSGFELRVDPARLRRGGRWEEGDWSVGLVLASASAVRVASPLAPEVGSGAAPVAAEVADEGPRGVVRVTPWYEDGRLRLSVARRTRWLAGHRSVAAGALEVAVRAPGPVPSGLRLTHRGTGTVVSFPAGAEPVEGGGVAFRVLAETVAAARPPRDGAPAAIPPAHTESWLAELVLPDGGTDRVACDPALEPVGYPLPHGRELVVAASPAGDLMLHDRTPQPYADRVLWRSDGTLLVAGGLPAAAPHATELVLKHGEHAAELTFPVTHDEGRFHGRLPLGALPSLAGPVPLREGAWSLHLRERGAVGSPLDAPVRLAPRVLDGLPASCTVGGKPLVVDRHRGDEVLVVAGPAVPAADRGPYRRRLLREQHYVLHRSRPLRDTVLYSSFGGRSAGDSPRAVHEELVRRGMDVEHLWAVRDGQTAVPATARAVVVGSAEWHGALAHSRWVVTNTHLPWWFTRRGGQRIVQTWHGTPLKRIGADLAGTLCAGLAHLAPRPRVSRQWSVLLSPNGHSTQVLRSALGFAGRVLETGLPRTDVLFAADRELRAAAVRERLGLEPGRRVVLYAPTPRDDVAYDARHHRLPLPLDLELARRELGDGHVLLVRGHPLVADRLPGHLAPFAVDVSAYPDAMELLLVADVLVTDYSSLTVDFANTGRPMLFLTPDLPHYRDVLRGFTLDFEARVPGPLLSSTGELVEALGDLGAVARASAGAYADFRAVFCHRDDGGAAGRVADVMER